MRQSLLNADYCMYNNCMSKYDTVFAKTERAEFRAIFTVFTLLQATQMHRSSKGINCANLHNFRRSSILKRFSVVGYRHFIS